MITALYNYEAAQAEGDLCFTTGDVIKILARTNNENGWWIGKLEGKEGQFPGKQSLKRLKPALQLNTRSRKLCEVKTKAP
jgi:hypothetical protein